MQSRVQYVKMYCTAGFTFISLQDAIYSVILHHNYINDSKFILTILLHRRNFDLRLNCK